MVSKEKKQEQNRKYREEKKKKSEEIEEEPIRTVEIQTQTEEEQPKVQEVQEVQAVQEVEETEEEDIEEVVISRATLNYLLSKAKEKEELKEKPEEEKKVISQSTESGFFFQLKSQMKNQMIASVGAMLPIIGMKMIMNGVEYLRTSAKPSPQVTRDTRQQPEQLQQPLNISEIQPFRCA